MQIQKHLPVDLARNDNVVKFADVDGAAFIFANMPEAGTETVRAQLDDIYAGLGLEFRTARHSSFVDVDIGADYDMLFIYE